MMHPAIFWMLVSHFVCDYPLQGEFLAAAKARGNALKFGCGTWVHALTAHAFIQAGGVALVTGSVALGLCEFVAHWLIDYGKCEGHYDLHVDQFFHLACKVMWALILFWSAA